MALTETSLFELDMANPNWRGRTGTPEFWAPDGLNWFAVSPAPTSGGFLIEGYREPPVLDNDSDYIDLGDEDLLKILDYAQWYMSFKEGIQEGLQNTAPLLQGMIEAAALRNSRLRKSAFYREFMGRHREEHERGGRAAVEKIGIRTTRNEE